MQTIELTTYAGDSFSNVAKKASALATEKQLFVQFDFNGINCIVSSNTDLEHLYRDYSNAHTMEWETVGPNCVVEYDEATAEDLKQRLIKREEEYEKMRQESQRKQELATAELENKIGSVSENTETSKPYIEFEAKNPELLKTYEEKNTDSYGAGIMSFAKRWGRLMQYEILQGKRLRDIADATSHEADTEGITGLMYGAAVAVLSECWVHGEDLRKWHNKEYGHEGEGVVNPAVITIG